MNKSIFHYTDFRKYLNDYYRQMKSKRNSFSHRFIEQRVGISQGYFCRILNGTKNISDSVIMKFIQFLKLTKNEGKFFENLVKYSQSEDPSIKAIYYSRMVALASPSVVSLAREQFTFFTQMHHVAVRALVSLVRIDDQSDFEVLGNLLQPPISGNTMRDSLRLLEKLDLVARNEEGVYKVTDRILSTGNHPGDLIIRTYLQNSLKRAAEALSTIPEKERMASTMTVSVSPKTYEQIIELLASTRQEINKLIEQESDASRIYQLSINFVPLSRQMVKDSAHER